MAYCKILLPDGVTELANIKSVTYREAVNSGVDLRPGCVGSASIEVEVFGAQSSAVSAGDALKYYQIDKNNTQTLIGTFYAEPVIATKNSYKFVAYDAASKLKADFSAWLRANQSNFPMTIKALVTAACTAAGVTLGSSSWSLSSQSVQAFYADGLTCRNILEYAAELGCKFVRCHTDGKVYFDWYATKANKRIYPSAGVSGSETRYAYKQDGLNYTNYTTTAIARVAVHPSGENDVAYIYPTGVNSGNTLNITNNLLLTGAASSLYNSAAQTIYTALNSLGTYRPATAHLFPRENPFRAGDIVAVTDSQGVSFTTVVMEATVSESDAALSSTGNQTYDEGSGNTAKSITQLASDVVRINKLKVDWADINTAIVNYLTANNVTAQNLAIVDENDNVLATFNASGITLGEPSGSRAEFDLNSFELFDKYGNKFASIGDLRDANGLANTSVEYTSIGQQEFSLIPRANTNYQPTVTVNGTVVSVQYFAFNHVRLATPAVGTVNISYVTDQAVYHYDLGDRTSGRPIGAGSVALGFGSEASFIYSTVGGGANNKAKHMYTVVSGGAQNEALAPYSAILGGQGNKVNLLGDYSSVVGGSQNEASGANSAVLGGSSNKASGSYSSVVGGQGNESRGNCQTVFGKYNATDSSMLEIVGNGTSDSSRSNARTLDASGNETLAGTLYVNGTDEVVADKSTDIDNADYWLTNRLPNGTFRARQFGRMVEVYGAWTGSTAPATGVLANSVATDYRPPYNYAILPIYSRTSPYVQVGTLWLYANGSVAFYGADGGGYVHGVYML